MQTASSVCGHTIGPLGGIGKAVGRRAVGMRVCLRIMQQKRRAEQKGRKGCGQWSVVSPRLRTDTPRHALGHLHPPQLSMRFGFWGEGMGRAVRGAVWHGDRRARSCRLLELQRCKILSWMDRRLWPRCVFGTAVSCRWRDGDSPTASARAVLIARQRLLFPQAGGLLSQGAVAAEALVLWIAHSVWRARVSSNISNSTTSEQPTRTALEPATTLS